MKISIVTPNLNYQDTLNATIESVIGNNYSDLEYIVLDGGSNDRSVDIIRQHEARIGHWASRPDKGPYFSINDGFERATGEIMGWLNSDDLYFPWTLRTVAEIFETFPQVEWLMGLPGTYQDGALRSVSQPKPYPQQLLGCGLYEGRKLGWVQQESTFWRRSLWDRAGPLDLSLKYAADFELWTRFASHAPLYAVETPLSSFHVRGNHNRSATFLDAYFGEIDTVIARMSEDRQRLRDIYWRELLGFRRWKPAHGVRDLLRRTRHARHLRGPVLNWDKGKAAYRAIEAGWLF